MDAKTLLLIDEDGDVAEGFESVQRLVDDSWRHGVRITQVFRRVGDGTYWQAKYRLSTDGETNELRDGQATIVQVHPSTVEAIVYAALT